MSAPIRNFPRPRFALALFFLCSLIAFALLLPGCSGSGNGTVASVSVTPATATVNIKGQQQFAAQALDGNGNQVLYQTFTWSSSDTTIATVAGSGVATGVAAGTAMITATSGGATSKPVTLTVVPVISSIAISPTTATIKVGASQQFTATATDVNGNTVPASFNWQNSSAAVATISTSGLLTGVSPGTVMITASAGSITSPVATVTVTP